MQAFVEHLCTIYEQFSYSLSIFEIVSTRAPPWRARKKGSPYELPLSSGNWIRTSDTTGMNRVL